MHNQIKLMLQMQDEMNRKVTEDWLTRGFEWYRAIWIECGELMDHHGWKWWKKQDPDIEQVKLEIIDIWHFGLSMLLESSKDHDGLIDSIADDFNYTAPSTVPLLEAVETLPLPLWQNELSHLRNSNHSWMLPVCQSMTCTWVMWVKTH